MGGQKNKAHKPGRRAGASARQKHNVAKGAQRGSSKQLPDARQGKMDRQNAAKQQRDHKRETLLAKKRQVGTPRVVTLLPMSQEIDVAELWSKLLETCAEPGAAAAGDTVDAMQGDSDAVSTSYSLVPTSAVLPGSHRQVHWVPPPSRRDDPLAIVELARHAEVVLLIFGATAEIDEQGERALGILKSFGLPTLVPVVLPPHGADLRVRSASQKLAAGVMKDQGLGESKVSVVDTAADARQLLRHLGDLPLKLPLWRQQRPSLVVEHAMFDASAEGSEAGTLILRGFVRALGLSANQAIHIPGAGDFQIDRISGPPRPQPVLGHVRRHPGKGVGDAMDAEGTGANVLAVAEPAERESLARENVPDPLAGEQTWPTEEELAAAGMDVDIRRRKVPKGTSEYQAAWILDDFEGDSEEEAETLEAGSGSAPASKAASQGPTEEHAWDEDMEMDDTETTHGEDDDAESAGTRKPSRREQQDDLQYPDEIDTPEGIPAKQRFAKYRGLKSWRTSSWDPKESLPTEYARIFAFQSIKRAEKRAKKAAAEVGAPGDPLGVPEGTYVDVHVAAVPSAVAASVIARVAAAAKGEAAPVVAFGLLQHETKLSVLNFSVRKATGFQEPLPKKAPLLFVTGYRSYPAQPIYSSDDHGASKFKMERFLHAGQSAVATVFAPIAYPPLPLLAFQKDEATGEHTLAATGSLRSCDPDRVILKRIVLSGYPVRVHKKKAVVRWMFHGPEDVRWFRPLELWTKHGLRGRIKEAVGTHGSMKCIFDGVVNQQDSVCASLYKRVFPKWPQDISFAGQG